MNVRSNFDSRALRVLLYTTIPRTQEHQPIRRTPVRRFRNRLRRQLDLLTWRATGIWRGHYSTFEDVANSNRGDIAVRIAVQRQLERALAGRNCEFVDVPWGELGRAIEESGAPWDLIVLAGGGFLFADNEGRLPPRFADDVEALQKTACPVIGISLGLNFNIANEHPSEFKFHSDDSALLEQFLLRLDLGSVRDGNAQKALAAVGPPALPVIVDPAFLLGARLPLRPNRVAMRSPLTIGLNAAMHGPHAGVINRNLLTAFARALHRFAANMPTRFIYFVHSDGERGVIAALRRYGLTLTVVDGPLDEMINAYRQLDLHVCQMLHSAILATSVGVPTLNLAYDIKSAGFFDLLGLPQLCQSAASLSENDLFAALTGLAGEREEIIAHLDARSAELGAEAHQFYRRIAALVDGAAFNRKREHYQHHAFNPLR